MFLLIAFAVFGAHGSAEAIARPSAPRAEVALADRVTLAPVPDWVDPVELPPAHPVSAAATDGGVAVLLVDRQVRVVGPRAAHAPAGPQRVERYFRVVRQVTHASGVSALSQVSIDFDPSYEQLRLHRVVIHRDGQVLDRLDPARIEVLRREPRLEFQLYDGRRSLLLLLHDLRVGDVVEEVVTRTGMHPTLDGWFSDRFQWSYEFPVDHVRVRLDWPADRQLRMTVHGGAAPHTARQIDGHVRYLWEQRKVPAWATTPSTPGWFEEQTWVQLSEHGTWAEVAAWAAPLYETADPPGGEVEAVADAIAATCTTDEDRLTAALRFVQDEVRYMSIALGTGSLEPTPPESTIRRRFGDCKDKTLLLVALLRRLDLDARPVLVNTVRRHGIEKLLPSPSAFDHVIARIRLGDGFVWVDPTSQLQRGPARALWLPDYGRGLVIDRATTALTPIEVPEASQPRTEVTYTVALGRSGEPATMTVRTEKRGGAADLLRYELSARAHVDLARDYRNYYDQYYRGIEISGDPSFEDDPAANVVTTTEQYRIPAFWTVDEAGTMATGSLVLAEALDSLRPPSTTVRTSPLALAHPVHLLVKLAVDLPYEFNIDPVQEVVETEAWWLEYRVTPTARHVDVTLEYRTLADSVATATLAHHLAKLRRGRDLSEFGLETPTDPAAAAAGGVGSGPLNLPILILIVVLVLGSSAGGFALVRRMGQAAADVPVDAPRLGGWLLLSALGLIVSPIRFAMDLGSTFGWVLDANQWHHTASTQPLTSGLTLLELGLNAILLTVFGVAAWLFFNKRRAAPVAMVAYFAAKVLIGALDDALVMWTGVEDAAAATPATTGGQVVMAAIWIAYFLRSERVRRTFVR